MNGERRNITGGLYLVADAGLDHELLLKKLQEALENGVSAVQLYNTENGSPERLKDIFDIYQLCHQYKVPVLANNHWELLREVPLDGVHFDQAPDNLTEISRTLGRRFLRGITCTNDLSVVQWANDNQMDYISFCSVFPTVSGLSCEIVSFETVRKARAITRLPIFLAGGIYPDNISQLSVLDFDGVAVISGIMASSNIPATTRDYISELNKIITL